MSQHLASHSAITSLIPTLQPATDASRKQADQLRQERALALHYDIVDLHDLIDKHCKEWVGKHNISLADARLRLGQYGLEMSKKQEVPNPYNGFVIQQLKLRNDAIRAQNAATQQAYDEAIAEVDDPSTVPLPVFESLVKAPWVAQERSELYASLNEEELEELRQIVLSQRKKAKPIPTGPGKYGELATRDMNSVNRSVIEQLDRAHSRNTQATIFISVKGHHDVSTPPTVYVSPNARKFLYKISKLTDSDFAKHLEAYVLNGTGGLGSSSRKECESRRSEIVACIRDSLRTASGELNPQMNYKNYLTQVEAKYGVRLVGWPLDTLKNPSTMHRDELLLVHEGLTAEPPSIFFQKLADEEVRSVRRAKRKAETEIAASKKQKPRLKAPSSLASSASSVSDSTRADIFSRAGSESSTATLEDEMMEKLGDTLNIDPVAGAWIDTVVF